jgi:hypothetical protein
VDSRTSIKGFLILLMLILSFFIFLFPLTNNAGDAWDGAIISYAASIQDFSGVKNWFFESGWPLQYFQILMFNEVANILNVKYETVNNLSIIFLMSICSSEVYLFSREKLQHSKYISYMSVVVFLAFPAWLVLTSNVMAYHFLCLTSALLGLRFFRYSNVQCIFIGLLLIIFSYTLSSLVVFLPALSYLCDSLDRRDPLNNSTKYIKVNIYLSYKTIIISVLGVVVFACNKVFYPSNGLYHGYNEIVSITSAGGLSVYIDNLIKYASFFRVLFVFILFYSLILIIKNKSLCIFRSLLIESHAFFILLFSAIFPYVAVGKSTTLLDGSFDTRQSLLLGFPLAILTVELYAIFSKEFDKNKITCGMFLSNLFFTGVTLSFMFVSFKNSLEFNERVNIKESIIEALRKEPSEIRPGIVQIISNRLPKDYFRTYEVNYMMYLAFGKAVWFSRISGDYNSSFNVSGFIEKNELYKIKYIYSYDGDHISKTAIDMYFFPTKNDFFEKGDSYKPVVRSVRVMQ